jgi:hypothetical protein
MVLCEVCDEAAARVTSNRLWFHRFAIPASTKQALSRPLARTVRDLISAAASITSMSPLRVKQTERMSGHGQATMPQGAVDKARTRSRSSRSSGDPW